MSHEIPAVIQSVQDETEQSQNAGDDGSDIYFFDSERVRTFEASDDTLDLKEGFERVRDIEAEGVDLDGLVLR